MILPSVRRLDGKILPTSVTNQIAGFVEFHPLTVHVMCLQYMRFTHMLCCSPFDRHCTKVQPKKRDEISLHQYHRSHGFQSPVQA